MREWKGGGGVWGWDRWGTGGKGELNVFLAK